MKKITAPLLNRFIFTLMMVLPAIIMAKLVCVTQVSAESSSEHVYEAWVARYDGPAGSYDEVAAIAMDSSGNVYVTGVSRGSGTSMDYATIKYDTNGNQLWLKRYDGPASGYDDARALAVDDSGNIYVTGRSVRSGDTTDYATIKYDTDGNQLWVAHYNGPGSFSDTAKSIALDSSGNVYVTGSSFGSGTDTDYATIKYDADGNQLWVKRYHGPGNSEDSATAIAVDGSGNVYVTGVSIGNGTYYDYATIKYDTDGNQIWVKRYNGPENKTDSGRALAVDGSGNVYVFGYSQGSGTDTDYDYATIKYDPDGNQIWVKRYDGPGNTGDDEEYFAIAVDGAGNAYITGDSGTIKYDTDGNQLWIAPHNSLSDLALDGSGNVYVTGWIHESSTSYDYATIKYDTDGNQLWIARYDSPGNGSDVAIAIALDASGNVYVTGNSESDYATIKYVSYIPGDINDDGYVDLGDAVLALLVMRGTTSAGAVYKEADVNGDNKIGLEEVIYILQKVSELR